MLNGRPLSEMKLGVISTTPIVPDTNNEIEAAGIKAINPNTPPPWGPAVEVQIVVTAVRETTGSNEAPYSFAAMEAAFAAAADARTDSWAITSPHESYPDSTFFLTEEYVLVDADPPDPDIWRWVALIRDIKWIVRWKPPFSSRMKIRVLANGTTRDIEWEGSAGIDMAGVQTIFRRAPGQDPPDDEDWIYDPAGESVWSAYDASGAGYDSPEIYFSTPFRNDPNWPPA